MGNRHAAFYALSACICACAILFYVGLTNDMLNLLFYAKHFQDDRQLYSYWQEVNPPLIFILYQMPLWLIEYAALQPAAAVYLFAILCAALSLCILWCQLKQAGIARDNAQKQLALASYILLALATLSPVFADREHLLFICILPYAFALIQKQKVSMGTALLAIIGFCIKPYNIIIWGALALGSVAHLGNAKAMRDALWTRTHMAMLAIALAYLAFILLVFPDYLITAHDALLTYGVLSETIYYKSKFVALALALFILPFIFLHFPNRPAWASFFAACVAVFIMNGGWLYTIYLLELPVVLLYGFLVLIYERAEIHFRFPKYWSGTIPAVILFLSLLLSLNHLREDIKATKHTGYAANYHGVTPQELQQLRDAAGDKFILLSTKLWSANITKLDGGPWHVFGYDYLWPVPWLILNPKDPRAPAIKARVTENLLTALTRYPDATLIVDISPKHRMVPHPFDLLGFFAEDARIQQQLKHYETIETIDFCDANQWAYRCAFRIYKRNDHQLHYAAR